MTPSRLLPLVVLTASWIVLACGGAGEAPVAAAPSANDHDGHDHAGDEISDLDQPVAELLAARCEHDLQTYRCDECRYEVGVVRAEEALFDPAQGGVLSSVEVRPGPAPSVREGPGEIVLDGNRTVTVTPLAEGVIAAVRRDLGHRVGRGETVLELECPAYREAAALLVSRAANETAAAATLAREEELHRRKICPEKDVVEARAQLAAAVAERRAVEGRLLALGLGADDLERLCRGDDPGWLAVRSPLDGEIVERRASVGSRVGPGESLMVVTDASRLWVETELRESDLAAALAAEEATAEVEVAAWPGRVFLGRLEVLAGNLDPTTRTLRARVVVANPEGHLRAGMFARVRLHLDGSRQALLVPREAVMEDEGRAFVFVHVEGPYWVRRPVREGVTSGDAVEIVEGLTAGDRIVTAGAFLCKSDVLRAKMGAGCAD